MSHDRVHRSGAEAALSEETSSLARASARQHRLLTESDGRQINEGDARERGDRVFGAAHEPRGPRWPGLGGHAACQDGFPALGMSPRGRRSRAKRIRGADPADARPGEFRVRAQTSSRRTLMPSAFRVLTVAPA